MEFLAGILLPEAVENSFFGADDKFVERRLLHESAHSAGGKTFVGGVAHVLRAFRMNEHGNAASGALAGGGYRVRVEPGVNRAVTFPAAVGSVQLPGDVAAEMLIGHEDDFIVRAEGAHHFFGVAGGHADIAFRLDFGGRIDVAYGFRAGMLGFKSAQLIAGDHVGHGAAGAKVGNENGLFRIEDRRGFGHEENAAEHDHVGVDLGCAAREFQRIAGIVGHILHFA